MARSGRFYLEFNGDKHWHEFQCAGQNYRISEELCDARQARSFRACRTCKVRKGGKEDPREQESKNIFSKRGAL